MVRALSLCITGWTHCTWRLGPCFARQYERTVRVALQVQRRAQREERLLPNQLRRGDRPATKEMKCTKSQALKQTLAIITASITDHPLISSAGELDPFSLPAMGLLYTIQYSNCLHYPHNILSYILSYNCSSQIYSSSFCEVVSLNYTPRLSSMSTTTIAHIVYYYWNNYYNYILIACSIELIT